MEEKPMNETKTYLAPGVHQIDDATYHADPAERPSLSSTLARLVLNRSPLHAWTAHPRLNPDWMPVEKKIFDIGRAAHRATLGNGADYVEIPSDMLSASGSTGTKAARAFIADARADGMTPLKAAEIAQIEEIAGAISAAIADMRIALDPDRSEMVAIAEIDGVLCRAMIDNVPADPRLPIYDLKTTEDASPDAVIRSIVNYGYDVQAAHYLEVWESATGERRKFRFIFVEKSAPFGVSVVELYDAEAAGQIGNEDAMSADWMINAKSKTAEARRIWGECLSADHWPGYPLQVAIAGAPAYYSRRWEDRVATSSVPQKPSIETLHRAAMWQAPERKTP